MFLAFGDLACRLLDFARSPEFAMSMSISLSGASPTSLLDTPKPAKPAAAKSVEQTFLDYAKMTPAERMHAQMLAQLGLTEDQFKAMDPAAQQKVEDKIREMVKQQVQNGTDKRTGIITDKTA
jgi:nitric oxide reductase activation protein